MSIDHVVDNFGGKIAKDEIHVQSTDVDNAAAYGLMEAIIESLQYLYNTPAEHYVKKIMEKVHTMKEADKNWGTLMRAILPLMPSGFKVAFSRVDGKTDRQTFAKVPAEELDALVVIANIAEDPAAEKKFRFLAWKSGVGNFHVAPITLEVISKDYQEAVTAYCAGHVEVVA
jgi:hypothetical protein